MKVKALIILILSFIIASCGVSSPRFTSEKILSEGTVKNEGIKESTPESDMERFEDSKPLDTFEGIASYYADRYNGRRTSNGEIYDMNSLTAASQDLPFETIVRVKNILNQKFVILRINDRGPLINGRLIDVSLEAAKRLEMIGKGTVKVQIEVLRYGKILK
jgi:rare lipoprotein A